MNSDVKKIYRNFLGAIMILLLGFQVLFFLFMQASLTNNEWNKLNEAASLIKLKHLEYTQTKKHQVSLKVKTSKEISPKENFGFWNLQKSYYQKQIFVALTKKDLAQLKQGRYIRKLKWVDGKSILKIYQPQYDISGRIIGVLAVEDPSNEYGSLLLTLVVNFLKADCVLLLLCGSILVIKFKKQVKICQLNIN